MALPREFVALHEDSWNAVTPHDTACFMHPHHTPRNLAASLEASWHLSSLQENLGTLPLIFITLHDTPMTPQETSYSTR